MTLSTMTNNILRHVPGLNPHLVESLINDAYVQLTSMEWRRLITTHILTTTPPYSVGRVTITSTGILSPHDGATFNSTFVGRYLRLYFSSSYFEITAFEDPNLTIQDWPGVAITTPSPYTIFKTTYTIPLTIRHIHTISSSHPLTKTSLTSLHKNDPTRQSYGEPTLWAHAGVTPTGQLKIELYPIPDSTYPLRIRGKVNVTPLTLDSTPLLPEPLIENLALIFCYQHKSRLEPNQGWDARLAEQSGYYKSLLDSYMEEDYLLYSHSDKVKDTLSERLPFSDDSFWVGRDDIVE